MKKCGILNILLCRFPCLLLLATTCSVFLENQSVLGVSVGPTGRHDQEISAQRAAQFGDGKRANQWGSVSGMWGKRSVPDFSDVDDSNLLDFSLAEDQPEVNKRNWEKLANGVWEKRYAKPLYLVEQRLPKMEQRGRQWEQVSGMWGKRASPSWSQVSGMWGRKRGSKGWSKLSSMWG